VYNRASIFSTIRAHGVGFKQTTNSCYPKISPSILGERYYFDSIETASSYLANEFVYDTAPSFEKIDIETYQNFSLSTSYSVGDAVKYNDGSNEFLYVSLQNGNLGNVPIWNSNFWETNLSSYLRKSLFDSIDNCLFDVFTSQNIQSYLPNFEQFANLFEQASFEESNLAILANNFVGISFILLSNRDLQVNIRQIGMKVDSAQTIPFYLYHTSNKNPIKTFNITFSAGDVDNYVWKDIVIDYECLKMNYKSDAHAAKGKFYIGFYESDIIGNYYTDRAYFKEMDWCGHAYISPITIQNNQLNKPNLFSNALTSNNSQSHTAFNLQYSVTFDYTESIKNTIWSFIKPFFYKTAIKILNDILIGNRNNRNATIARERIPSILNTTSVGNENKVTTTNGLNEIYEKCKKQINLNFDTYRNTSKFQIGHSLL
jgi:hypothetical protein